MTAPARLCHCPNCGADADEKARHCAYCKAPIATVRCAHCFELNVASAAHCSGCGRDLGLEPISDGQGLACPGCSKTCHAFRGGSGKLYDCEGCGGQFVENALLSALLEEREVYGSALPAPLAKANPLTQKVKYLPCPSCRELMNRKNFGGSSGVIVDVCTKHGVWFDSGELPRVLAFVQKGGLVKARQRERENEERRQKERIAARASAVAVQARGDGATSADVSLLGDVAGGAEQLFYFVTGLLRDR
jgi:Zn-finger nucleic acid-binding protein